MGRLLDLLQEMPAQEPIVPGEVDAPKNHDGEDDPCGDSEVKAARQLQNPLKRPVGYSLKTATCSWAGA